MLGPKSSNSHSSKQSLARHVASIPLSLVPSSILVKVYIFVSRHLDQGNFYNGHLILTALQFQGLRVHCQCGEKNGSMKAHVLLKEDLRVLHLDFNTVRRRLSSRKLGRQSQYQPYSDTSSNNATASPTRPNFLTVSLSGSSIYNPPQ